MNKSIDYIIENLLENEQKLNEISNYLFILLEKRSLFEASDYLALKLLNEQACTINKDLAAQLESYRAMKVGNTAPDFAFGKDCFAPGYEAEKTPLKLSDLNSKYTLVIFGASWCPQCPQELSQIAGLYEKWKTQGLEVVLFRLMKTNKYSILSQVSSPLSVLRLPEMRYSKGLSCFCHTYPVFIRQGAKDFAQTQLCTAFRFPGGLVSGAKE